MKTHDFPRRRGDKLGVAVHAAEHPAHLSDLDETSPLETVRLGFDPAGQLLEVVMLRFDSGNELLIHAMKARRHYHQLLD